jgi:hypothetical protein
MLALLQISTVGSCVNNGNLEFKKLRATKQQTSEQVNKQASQQTLALNRRQIKVKVL